MLRGGACSKSPTPSSGVARSTAPADTSNAPSYSSARPSCCAASRGRMPTGNSVDEVRHGQLEARAAEPRLVGVGIVIGRGRKLDPVLRVVVARRGVGEVVGELGGDF